MMWKRTVSIFMMTIATLFSDTIRYNLNQEAIRVTTNLEGSSFESREYHTEPGQPMLPVQRLKFLLPPDADLSSIAITLEIDDTCYVPINAAVAPAPLERTESELLFPTNRTVVDGKDTQIYTANAYFPNSFLQPHSTGGLRDYKIVSLTLFPYLYNPVQEKLKQLTNSTLKIQYRRLPGARTSASYEIPQHTSQLLKKLVCNYNEMISEYDNFPVSRAANGGYVIITTSAIESGSQKLNDFINSKRSRGFTVETVTDLGSADNIREWLKDNYQTKNIEYVLLIGDPTTGSGDVPMKMTHPWRETPTDFYYGDLSGDWDKNGNGIYGETGDLGSGGIDLLSEVGVGRIPVYGGDYATLDEILAKTIAYENAPENEIAWRRKLMMAMKGYNAPAEGSRVGEAVKNKVSALNSDWSYYRIYDDGTGGPELTGVSENFILYAMGMVETGFVIWMTHGSATDAMSVMSVNGTKQWNKQKQAFVFCGSCLNAKPSHSGNLTYSLLKNGSVGAIGGTQTTLFSTGSSMENTGFNSAYIYQFSTNLAGKNMHVIDALNMIKASNTPSGSNLQNYMAFTLYGCPAIGIETNGSGVSTKHSQLIKSGIHSMDVTHQKSHNTLRISYTATQTGPVTLSLFSAEGKIVRKMSQEVNRLGAHTLTTRTEELPAGFYLLQLQGIQQTLVKKVILQR